MSGPLGAAAKKPRSMSSRSANGGRSGGRVGGRAPRAAPRADGPEPSVYVDAGAASAEAEACLDVLASRVMDAAAAAAAPAPAQAQAAQAAMDAAAAQAGTELEFVWGEVAAPYEVAGQSYEAGGYRADDAYGARGGGVEAAAATEFEFEWAPTPAAATEFEFEWSPPQWRSSMYQP